MYCPNCGGNNPDDLKFCTRCGTNLGVVSDALRARTADALPTDETTVALLKDFYRGRRMMFIGAAASALALFKLAGPFMLGFPEKLIPIVVLSLGFLFLSLLALVWGLIKWNNSSSEIKARGLSPSKRKLLKTAALDQQVASPNSVTEHTTHILHESDDSPPTRKDWQTSR